MTWNEHHRRPAARHRLSARTPPPRVGLPPPTADGRTIPEDAVRLLVAVVGFDGDHSVFGLYRGGSQNHVPRPDGGLGIGRYFRPDELVPSSEPP
jgi:hypothetical protein